jgi:hypothetical protein
MRRPASIMVAIGLPLARDDEAREQDEDGLHRERDDDADSDVAEQIIMHLVKCLHGRGPGAVRQLRLLAQSFAQMADAHMERDGTALEDAAADAHKALSKIFGN